MSVPTMAHARKAIAISAVEHPLFTSKSERVFLYRDQPKFSTRRLEELNTAWTRVFRKGKFALSSVPVYTEAVACLSRQMLNNLKVEFNIYRIVTGGSIAVLLHDVDLKPKHTVLETRDELVVALTHALNQLSKTKEGATFAVNVMGRFIRGL